MPVFVVLFGCAMAFLIPLAVERIWRCHDDTKIQDRINVTYPQVNGDSFILDFEQIGFEGVNGHYRPR